MKRRMLKHDVTELDGLILEDVDVPEPGPGQVRVRVEAVSLNTRDLMVVPGPFGRLPDADIVPGSNMSGRRGRSRLTGAIRRGHHG